MNLKNILKGPWTKKKGLLLFSLVLILPLAIYGVTTGLRLLNVYQTVHDPVDEEQVADYQDQDYEVSSDPSEDSSVERPENNEDDEPSDAEDSDSTEEDASDKSSEEDPEADSEKAEDFPGSQDDKDSLDLVPITGDSVYDFQEIDRPFYEATTTIHHSEHINILLLGLDEDLDEPGRSDAIMLLQFNIETEEAAILSIPRDTYMHVPDHGFSKAGHTTAYGGRALALSTLEVFLDISIDHYLQVDMGGFENSVDALGGVTLTIPERMVQEDGEVLFEAGSKHMDGEDALEYTRTRKLKEGTGGDLGRIRRQQQVVFEMLRKIRSELTLSEALSFLEEVSPFIRTDIGPGLIMEHWGAFRGLDFQKITVQTLPGEGFMHEGVYYYRVPVENARMVMEALSKPSS